MNIIVRCSCGGVSTYVKSSMDLLKLAHTDKEYVGKEKIRTLAQQHPDTTLAQHLQVIAKKSGRYAYYISTDDDHNITSMYNLIKGQKVY